MACTAWSTRPCHPSLMPKKMATPSTLERKERSEPVIAQQQPAPEQRAENYWEQDLERSLLGAHVGVDRTAQVPGQEDGARTRCAESSRVNLECRPRRVAPEA